MELPSDRKNSYDYDELLSCANGTLFSPDSGRLPLPGMLMTDRINLISKEGGEYGKGEIHAELDINPEMWFFKSHFHEDPVMPGCLGLDAMWQLVGFYLGWMGEPGKGRALGVNSVRFTGEVIKKVKMATYEVNMKKVLKTEGGTVGFADGILKADDKQIYTAENLKVGVYKQ